MAPRITKEAFLERARAIHGDKYDYSQVDYVDARTKVKIVCPRHGPFWQTPTRHMAGAGCMRRECKAEAREKALRAKYGDGYEAVVAGKRRETVTIRYGVPNPMQAPGPRARRAETCMDKYGSPSPLGSPEVTRKRIATCEERYGGPGPMSSAAVRAKRDETVLRRYGVRNVMQLPEVRCRQEASREAGKRAFGRRRPVDEMAEALAARFGKGDVVRDYFDPARYPFECDFYIKSRDLFIEANMGWNHGGHWYDEALDAPRMAVLLEKARTSALHASMVRTWTKVDVGKRLTAAACDLNYLVVWDAGLRDFDAWMAAGCPDARDWLCAWSWVDRRSEG